MKYYINSIISAFLTSLTYLFGGWDLSLRALLLVIVLDYITGVLKSIKEKKLNSKINAIGIIKKIGYLIIVALAVLLDKIIGNSGAIRALVIYFFIANEGISILENWAWMGLPLPQNLYDILEQIKKKKE